MIFHKDDNFKRKNHEYYELYINDILNPSFECLDERTKHLDFIWGDLLKESWGINKTSYHTMCCSICDDEHIISLYDTFLLSLISTYYNSKKSVRLNFGKYYISVENKELIWIKNVFYTFGHTTSLNLSKLLDVDIHLSDAYVFPSYPVLLRLVDWYFIDIKGYNYDNIKEIKWHSL